MKRGDCQQESGRQILGKLSSAHWFLTSGIYLSNELAHRRPLSPFYGQKPALKFPIQFQTMIGPLWRLLLFLHKHMPLNHPYVLLFLLPLRVHPW